MEITKNYYKILGVLSDAEDIVIRAAYRALAQRYHPDRFQGDKDVASRRMAEINEAYNTLSDPERRKEYDSRRHTGSGKAENFEDDFFQEENGIDSFEDDWNIACSAYPDLHKIISIQRKISYRLEKTYCLFLLESKLFDQRMEISAAMIDHFLAGYFSNRAELKDYACKLILGGKRDAALALNKMVRIIGDRDPKTLIDKIELDYVKPESERIRAKQEKIKKEEADNLKRQEEAKIRQEEERIERMFERYKGQPRSAENYECRKCHYLGKMVLTPLDKYSPSRLNGLICPSCHNISGR